MSNYIETAFFLLAVHFFGFRHSDLGFDWFASDFTLRKLRIFDKQEIALPLSVLDGGASIQLNIGGPFEGNSRPVDPGRARVCTKIDPD
jgi:hypothetical protein